MNDIIHVNSPENELNDFVHEFIRGYDYFADQLLTEFFSLLLNEEGTGIEKMLGLTLSLEDKEKFLALFDVQKEKLLTWIVDKRKSLIDSMLEKYNEIEMLVRDSVALQENAGSIIEECPEPLEYCNDEVPEEIIDKYLSKCSQEEFL